MERSPPMLHVLRSSGFAEAADRLSVHHEFLREDGKLVLVSAWGALYRVTVRRPSTAEPSGWDRFPETREAEPVDVAFWLGTDGHRAATLVLPGQPT